MVTRPKFPQALTSVPGCPSAVDLFTKQNDVIVTLLLSWYSVNWYSVFLVFANRILTDKKYTAACSLRNNIVKLVLGKLVLSFFSICKQDFDR